MMGFGLLFTFAPIVLIVLLILALAGNNNGK